MKKALKLMTSIIFATGGLSLCSCKATYFTVTFDSQGGTPVESLVVKKGSYLQKPTTEKTGYTFKKWNYNGKTWHFDTMKVVSDMTLEAYWSINSYRFNVLPNDINMGSVWTPYGEQEYKYNTKVKLGYSVNTYYAFDGWYEGDQKLGDANDFEYTIPAYDVVIIGKFKFDEENYRKIGKYPSSKVTNETTINNLNELAGTLPTEDNAYNWTPNKHTYKKGVETNHRFYIDINVGSEMYRGVYFTQSHDYKAYDEYGYYFTIDQEENGYYVNTVYWFIYEPVIWKIMETKDNKILLLTEQVYEACHYKRAESEILENSSTYDGQIYKNVPAVDYTTSYVREELNVSFYNTCFSSSEKEKILSTTLSSESSKIHSTSFVSPVNDKLFILSFDEYVNYGYYNVSNTYISTRYDSPEYSSSIGAPITFGHISYCWTRSCKNSKEMTPLAGGNVMISELNINSFAGIQPAMWISK